MSNEANRNMEDKVNEELEQIFNGQTSVTKEKMRQALEGMRGGGGGGRGRGGRGRGGMDRSSPSHDDMKNKACPFLECELKKINSNTITKEQAKSVLLAAGKQAKEQWRAQKDEQVQSSIKDELNKLNLQEVNATQARDLLRNVCQKMCSPHGCGPSVLDDSMKQEFMNEFKNKHGANKINADEVWEMIKSCDKKQHEKMGCEKNCERDKDKDKKWEEIFNEQFKESFGDLNKTKINQQQLEELARKVKDKCRQECAQQPGKRNRQN
jgi:hypothetical protein